MIMLCVYENYTISEQSGDERATRRMKRKEKNTHLYNNSNTD